MKRNRYNLNRKNKMQDNRKQLKTKTSSIPVNNKHHLLENSRQRRSVIGMKNNIVEQTNKLIGKTFKNICNPDEIHRYSNRKDKGILGKLIEEQFFGLKMSTKRKSDLPNLEIKTSECYHRKRDGGLSSRDRLVLGMINYHEIVEESFKKSHILNKCKNMLIIYYERRGKDKLDSEIIKVLYLSFSDEQINELEKDYDIIRDYVIKGKAHLLSEKHTKRLGACTKSGNNSKRYTTQPNSDKLAKTRAFSLKASYMTKLLE